MGYKIACLHPKTEALPALHSWPQSALASYSSTLSAGEVASEETSNRSLENCNPDLSEVQAKPSRKRTSKQEASTSSCPHSLLHHFLISTLSSHKLESCLAMPKASVSNPPRL